MTRHKKHLTMRELPEADRPAEKLWRLGAQALTAAELIAVVIRSGSGQESALALGQRLIAQSAAPDRIEIGSDASGINANPDGLQFLRDSSPEELTTFFGIGKVKAVQLKAALELGRRAARTCGGLPAAIRSPDDVMPELESQMAHLPREEMRLISLDIRNRIIRVSRLGEGGLAAAVVQPRDIFREAVRANAAALILAHNHPSGDATPSSEDIQTTRRLGDLGAMMGVPILDHLIIASGGSVSLRQRGLI